MLSVPAPRRFVLFQDKTTLHHPKTAMRNLALTWLRSGVCLLPRSNNCTKRILFKGGHQGQHSLVHFAHLYTRELAQWQPTAGPHELVGQNED